MLLLEQLLHPVSNQRTLLAHTLRLQADRHQRRAGGQTQQFVALGLVHIRQRRGQPGLALSQDWLGAGYLLTTALDGRQQPAGLVRDQQQHGVAGGLLKAVQQCVGSIDVHGFDRPDQHHLAAPQLRRLPHEGHQLTDLVDLDRLIGLFGLKDVVVRVATGLQQQAGLAGAAGIKALRLLAQQAGHQTLGHGPLANALRPVQQVGMGMLTAPGQLLPERLLPWVGLSHGNAPRWPATAHR